VERSATSGVGRMMAKRKPAAERFWEKVDRSGGPDACWLWTGARTAGRYGHFCLHRGTQCYAHRIMAHLHIGFLPRNLCVCHRVCDNPPCVNPRHLFVGTKRDNMRDRDAKGRTPCGERYGKAKLTWTQVFEIRESSESQRALASRFGVSRSQIANIRTGRRWKTPAPMKPTHEGAPDLTNYSEGAI
jgi:hypothetical protein